MTLGDPGDVLRPLVPVDAGAALLDELRLDGLLPTIDGIERETHLHALNYLIGPLLLGLLAAFQALVPSLVVGCSLVLVLRRLLM